MALSHTEMKQPLSVNAYFPDLKQFISKNITESSKLMVIPFYFHVKEEHKTTIKFYMLVR